MNRRVAGSGYFAAPNDVFEAPDLSAQERLVLLYLYRCAGPDGGSWPSYSTIAEATGMARSTAVKAVQGLLEAGWLAVEGRHRPDGSRASNVYRLTRPARGGGHNMTTPGEGWSPGGLGGHHTDGGGHLADCMKDNPVKDTDDDGDDARTRLEDDPLPLFESDAGDVPDWLKRIADAFFTATGRMIDYARDGPVLRRARDIASTEQILRAIERGMRQARRRPKAFAYFVPIVEQIVEEDQAREEVAAGGEPRAGVEARGREEPGLYGDLYVHDGPGREAAG